MGDCRLQRSEWDIAAEIDYQFKNLGAAHTSFVTGIFFAGEAHDRNTVAGRASEKRLQRGDSVMPVNLGSANSPIVLPVAGSRRTQTRS